MITRIPVDLYNPGHVFASLGLVEALEGLFGIRATSRFVTESRSTIGAFEIEASVDDPVERVVAFLVSAQVTSIVPKNDALPPLSTLKWQVSSIPGLGQVSETTPPRTPATLPARLSDDEGRALVLDSWADDRAIGRDNVKFWAGAGGYPGAGLARDAITLLRDASDEAKRDAVRDPFAMTAPMSSSFRFDWRRDYIPLEVGFSPNSHTGMTMIGYPLVELLAAIGLENARPSRVRANDKLRYRYATWHDSLPAPLARAALGDVDLGFARRSFIMDLGWPGQVNQARCIVSVREVSS